MVRIEFLGPIKKEPLNIDIKNLQQLSEMIKNDKTLSPWINNSAVAVNDELVKDKNFMLKDGDKVTLLPPVCGG